MALSADAPVTQEVGNIGAVPVKASTKIYCGAMVGLVSGYARGLAALDVFVGHALEQADNSATATDGYINCKVLTGRYRLKVTIASVAVTDVGKDVFASADGTLSLTKSIANTLVGKVVRYVTTNTCVVEFNTAKASGDALVSPVVLTGLYDLQANKAISFDASATTVKLGLYGKVASAQPASIADAASTLGDLKTKLNSLLAAARSVGVVKKS